MYYVYMLVDPTTGIPFYVGKGKNNRASNHWKWNSSKGGNLFKDRCIARIVESGLEPSVQIYQSEIQDEDTAYCVEEHLIKRLGRRGKEANGVLTNICLTGGRPPSRHGIENGFYGKKHTIEARQLFSKNARRQFTGTKQTRQHVAKRVAKMDKAKQRERRIANNQTDFMRQVTAKANFDKGYRKTRRLVEADIVRYFEIVQAIEAGIPIVNIRDQFQTTYMFVFQIKRKLQYYKNILRDISDAEQKQD